MSTALGAFHRYAEGLGAEISCPLVAHAWPSGPVDDEAFEAMAAALLADIGLGCDMILLDLHGAMVTQSHDDGEGELLARIRRAAPGVPVGVALDLHGNITRKMVENCDVLIGFKTYPHIDMFETGAHVCRVMEQIRSGGARPRMALVQPPLLAHTLMMNTTVDGAMADIVALSRAAEAEAGVLGVTFFGGFPAADLAEAGPCVVAVTTADLDPAAVAGKIADAVWARREGFVYTQEPLADSIAASRRAAEQYGGPVLMLDHGDNCMSGGTCDNMDVLEAALEAGLGGIVAGPFHDPQAVAEAFAAGSGSEITLEIGNKIAADGFPAPRPPLRVTGRVSRLGDGRYTITGPIYTGMECAMGRAAVIDTGTAKLLVTETTHEPWDQSVFLSVGIDPAEARYLVMKSRMYCRPVFEPLASAVVECAGGGVTGSDYSLFPFRKLRRPIYPLELAADRWQPEEV